MRVDLVVWRGCFERGPRYFGWQRCTRPRFYKAEMPPTAVNSDIFGTTIRSAADVDVLRVIGFLQIQHGKVDEAVGVFEALYALFPEDINIGLSLSYALLQVGNALEASFILEKIEAYADSSFGNSNLQRNACFCWLRSQAFSGTGQSVEAARWMRLFLRLRRQSNLKVTS